MSAIIGPEPNWEETKAFAEKLGIDLLGDLVEAAKPRWLEDAAYRPRLGQPESMVVDYVERMVENGVFADALGLPRVIHWQLEYVLPSRRRIDVLAVNEDGGLSIIECKPDSTAQTVLKGLGQALLYGFEVGMSRGIKGPIRVILAAPMDPLSDETRSAAMVCKKAGARLWPVGFCEGYLESQIAFFQTLLELKNGAVH